MKKIHIIMLFFILGNFIVKIYPIEFDDDLDAYLLTREDYLITFDEINLNKAAFENFENIINDIEWELEEDNDYSDYFDHEYMWLRISYPDIEELNDSDNNKYLILKLHGHSLECYINGIKQNYSMEKRNNKIGYVFIYLDKIKSGDQILLKLGLTLYNEHEIYISNSEDLLNNKDRFILQTFHAETSDFLIAFIIFLIGVTGILIYLFNRKKKIIYLLWFSIFAVILGVSHALSTDILVTFFPISSLSKELIEIFAFDLLSIILIMFYISYFSDSWRKYFHIFIAFHLLILIQNIIFTFTGQFIDTREFISFFYPAIEYIFIWFHLTIKVKKKFPAQYFRYAFISIAVTYFLQFEDIFGELIADTSLNIGFALFFFFLCLIPLLTFNRQAALIIEQNIMFEKFVPKEFLNFLSKESITEIRLGDQKEEEITILFADIRSFTSISENLSPEEIFDKLNKYLAVVGPIIRKNNGFIDKYIGDAVMALFPVKAEDAVNAALEMISSLENNNEIDFTIGIGIHRGKTMLGIIGENERIESTVISDTVNTASRLESLTKEVGRPLVFSEEVASLLDNHDLEYLGETKIRGKENKIKLFSIKDNS